MEASASMVRLEKRPAAGPSGRQGRAIANRNDNSKWANKQLFTTGEAAEICKVSQQTIIRAFDNGRLRGFRVPGSRFRRILRGELLRYMQATGVSTDTLEGRVRRVLMVENDQRLSTAVRRSLISDGAFEVEAVDTAFDAGVLTEQFRPHVVLLDDSLPDVNVELVCQRVREHPDLSGTKIIVLSRLDHSTNGGTRPAPGGADLVVTKPVKVPDLVRYVRGMV
jgi:excisionase family DNA binding protein